VAVKSLPSVASATLTIWVSMTDMNMLTVYTTATAACAEGRRMAILGVAVPSTLAVAAGS
jgi:hypothetical protein